MESRYNYFVKNGHDFVCLNGISGKVFKIAREEFKLLKSIISNEVLQKSYPSIVNRLYEDGFLIKNDVDEIGILRDAYMKDKQNPIYHLVINPTLNCNFKCWYCYEKHPKEFMDSAILINVENLIYKKISSGDIGGMHLSWFGGEPLMCFDNVVYPISLFTKRIANDLGKKYSNSMTTNGYFLTEQVIKRCEEIDLRFLQITIDGNEEMHDQVRNHNGEPTFRRIFSNCINFCSFSTQNKILLRINYTNKNIGLDYDKLLNDIPNAIRNQITVDFQRVWQTYEEESGTGNNKLVLQRSKSKIRQNNFNVVHNSFFTLRKGCVCYADRQNYLHINYDGHVYRCTAKDYNEENALGVLDVNGNVIWKNSTDARINEKPFFENAKCLDCHYLPLCGGPCFSRKNNYKDQLSFCDISKYDMSIEQFVNDYYDRVCE